MMLSQVELRGDQLLLAGGFSDLALTPADGLEIFDPRTSEFSRPGPAGAQITLSVARGGHAAVGFAGARVLMVGGLGPEGLLGSGEIFTARETE